VKKLLTIAVPTYNRGYLLPRFFQSLWEAIGPCVDSIEVFVSDNNSRDGTDEIITEWVKRAPRGLLVTRHRQHENVGAARNLLYVMRHCNSRYFHLLGDDDRLAIDSLPKVLNILEAAEQPSAVVGSRTEEPLPTAHRGLVPVQEIGRYIYQFGCAPAGIFDRATAINVIDSHNLWDFLGSVVWPQTFAGFAAACASEPRPAYIADFTLGGLLTNEWQTVATRAYWTRCLTDLLIVAEAIDRIFGKYWLRKSVFAQDCTGFHSMMQQILMHALAGENAAKTGDLQRLLRRRFGLKGQLWAAKLWLSDRPAAYRQLFSWRWRLRRLGSATGLEEALNTIRAACVPHSQDVTSQNKRRGDWF
jgi:glycosyltransferase involved in cell wall biosynthesis